MPKYFLRKNDFDFLRRLRLEASLSQREVAQTVGINPAVLSAVECGYSFPSPSLVEEIQAAIAKLDSQRRQRMDLASRELSNGAEASR